jgi:hypothetical protein
MHNMEYVNAFFTDDKRTDVTSYWRNTEGEIVEISLAVEAEDAEWKELLEYVTLDEIHENTYNYIKQSQQAYKDQVIEIAKERGWLVNMDDGGTSDFHRVLVDMLFDPYEEALHKEKLFFFKMQLFEKDAIRLSKDKDAKKKVRRASNFLDAIRAAIEIADANPAQASTDASD